MRIVLLKSKFLIVLLPLFRRIFLQVSPEKRKNKKSNENMRIEKKFQKFNCKNDLFQIILTYDILRTAFASLLNKILYMMLIFTLNNLTYNRVFIYNSWPERSFLHWLDGDNRVSVRAKLRLDVVLLQHLRHLQHTSASYHSRRYFFPINTLISYYGVQFVNIRLGWVPIPTFPPTPTSHTISSLSSFIVGFCM